MTKGRASRQTIGLISYSLAISASVLVAMNIVWLVGIWAAPFAFLHEHMWLWLHSDDKHMVRVFIDSWLFALGVFLISLFLTGPKRKVSLIVAGMNVVAFPAFVILFTYLTTFIHRPYR
jgi:hypothetical protein